MARLASSVLVSALIKRVNAAGGSAMVLAKGHREAGAVLVLTLERGREPRFFERGPGTAGDPALVESGPRDRSDEDALAYWQRRRKGDPDLWVIELDIADAQRFAAETLL